jgi:hypothetical protein
MKVEEEIKNALPRQSEIVEYERANAKAVDECHNRLKAWFAGSCFLVGRGGHHVYVSKPNGQRILLITE